jgi:hypothetical protein
MKVQTVEPQAQRELGAVSTSTSARRAAGRRCRRRVLHDYLYLQGVDVCMDARNHGVEACFTIRHRQCGSSGIHHDKQRV